MVTASSNAENDEGSIAETWLSTTLKLHYPFTGKHPYRAGIWSLTKQHFSYTCA